MESATCNACPPKKVTRERIVIGLGVVAVAYFFLQYSGLLRFSPEVAGVTSLGSVFVVGLVAALSSCTAMVTGVVAAASATQARPATHVLFNAGRIAGFAGFGALMGAAGQVLKLSTFANGIMIVAIALLMITLGANLMQILPKGVWFLTPPSWLTDRIVLLSQSKHPGVPVALGIASFFLPCGFTQSMQLYALSTGDPLQASVIMTIFALGTLPSLLGVGLLTSTVQGVTRERMSYAIGVMVMALGVSNVQNGMTLMGFSGFQSSTASVEASQLVMVDGKQRVEMEISPYGYQPQVIQVVEDVPVLWEIYGTEQMGCANTLVAPAFDIGTTIVPGFNEVTFTPTEPGTYVFSCSMGMVRGSMVVLPRS